VGGAPARRNALNTAPAANAPSRRRNLRLERYTYSGVISDDLVSFTVSLIDSLHFPIMFLLYQNRQTDRATGNLFQASFMYTMKVAWCNCSSSRRKDWHYNKSTTSPSDLALWWRSTMSRSSFRKPSCRFVGPNGAGKTTLFQVDRRVSSGRRTNQFSGAARAVMGSNRAASCIRINCA